MTDDKKCPFCKGSGICNACNGTGDGKSVTPHPSSRLVDPRTGVVRCPACEGSGTCMSCKGTGKD